MYYRKFSETTIGTGLILRTKLQNTQKSPPTFFHDVLISEEEDHLLVLHAQLVVQDLQVLPERALVVTAAQRDLKHL